MKNEQINIDININSIDENLLDNQPIYLFVGDIRNGIRNLSYKNGIFVEFDYENIVKVEYY